MFDISSLTENPVNLAIVAAVFLIIIYILFRVASSIFKLILVAGVIGLAYYFWQGGTVDELKDSGIEVIFKDANLSNMKAIHCDGTDSDRTKCTCIVEPVYDDIYQRLTREEIARINTSDDAVKEELRKSMKRQRKEIRKCLIDNKGSKLIDQLKNFLTN